MTTTENQAEREAFIVWAERRGMETSGKDAGHFVVESTRDAEIAFAGGYQARATPPRPTDAHRRCAEAIEKFMPRYFSDDTLCPSCGADAGACPHSLADMLTALLAQHLPGGLVLTAEEQEELNRLENWARYNADLTASHKLIQATNIIRRIVGLAPRALLTVALLLPLSGCVILPMWQTGSDGSPNDRYHDIYGRTDETRAKLGLPPLPDPPAHEPIYRRATH